MYYAHAKEGLPEEEWQKLAEHLIETSELAGRKAAKFNAEVYGRMAGLLHDAGKYSDEFQRRLRGSKLPVDHSTAGAKEAYGKYGMLGLILSYVVAGHHTGIPDWLEAGSDSSLSVRLHDDNIPDFKKFHDEITLVDKLPFLPIAVPGGDKEKTKIDTCFSYSFFIRMLFSCLVDADFRNTEEFINPEKSKIREIAASFNQLLDNLNKYIEAKYSGSGGKEINRKRNEILTTCIRKAEAEKGMFSLKVPTGGGKTLSSLQFAIRHAIEHEMDRIIYVIPYTSIIEQNAEVFREALGEEYVLEHHSNFQFDRDENELECKTNPIRLAAEDWNIPVVVTTNVQFFESLFSNRSSRCRKLHNICNSVIGKRLRDCSQVLCIVNTKSRASQVYDYISGSEGAYHLSTFICPKHRTKKLKEIKERLKAGGQGSNIPCRVVSTQLVEAGVDLDFPIVYREIAGIDSINQAAGRCNREGRPELGEVFIFEPEKPLASDSFLARAASIGRSVLRKYDDPMSLDAIKDYFHCLYHQDESLLDKYRIIELLSESGLKLQFPFATVARQFQLIRNNQVSIIIPYDENCFKLISDAQWMDKPMKLARKLQPYVVQLEIYQYNALVNINLIETVADVFNVLADMKYYDENKGLILPKGVIQQDVLIC